MSIESAKSKDFISEDPGGSSLWRDAWIRLRANRLATISLYFFIFVSLLTILGPEILTSSYEDQDLNNTFAPPGKESFFGYERCRVVHLLRYPNFRLPLGAV